MIYFGPTGSFWDDVIIYAVEVKHANYSLIVLKLSWRLQQLQLIRYLYDRYPLFMVHNAQCFTMY